MNKKQLIIAEKASVAKAIAHSLGVREKISSNDSLCYCFVDENHYITYASGHLYDIGMPADYGYNQKWNTEDLPIIPDFKVFEKTSDKDNSFEKTRRSLRNFISALMKKDDVGEIICATDAAREGQLIFDHIYSYNECSKPCKRLWVSSLTDEAIKKAFSEMKPISDYELLLRAAKSREKLDWLFGMNLSRLYSVLDETTHKIGRVKTPLLSIVVDRDTEILNFTPEKYYQLILCNGAQSKRYFDKSEVDKLSADSEGKVVEVTLAEKKQREENRPKLYSLLTAQMDANELYGYTAEETLDIVQKLYEKKLVTYPRTDSEHISDDMVSICTEIVHKLADNKKYEERIKLMIENGLNFDKRVVDNEKISDHHAIIPTENIYGCSFTEDEENIYEMIINHFLMALDKKHIYTECAYKFLCNDVEYTLNVKTPIEMGWRAYEYNSGKSDEECSVEYDVGDTFTMNGLVVKESFTQSKKHYTDKTLLMVMDNIDNRIDNPDLKKSVEKKGIGTPATRAGIIEELIDIGYIERKGKQIIATDFGINFSNSLPIELKSVERTAEWERVFDDIQHKGISADELEAKVIKLINDTISYEINGNSGRTSVKNPNATPLLSEPLTKCPECGKDVVDKGKFYGCTSYISKDEKGCGFSFSKTVPFIKDEISTAEFKKLIAGETVALNAVGKNGVFKSNFKIEKKDDNYNLVYVQSEREVLGKCPLCGKDIVLKGKFYGCTSYVSKDEKGCGFSLNVADEYHNIKLYEKNVTKLLNGDTVSFKKKTINGFVENKYKLDVVEKNGRKYVNLVRVD